MDETIEFRLCGRRTQYLEVCNARVLYVILIVALNILVMSIRQRLKIFFIVFYLAYVKAFNYFFIFHFFTARLILNILGIVVIRLRLILFKPSSSDPWVDS